MELVPVYSIGQLAFGCPSAYDCDRLAEGRKLIIGRIRRRPFLTE